jgi:hypothetical protein
MDAKLQDIEIGFQLYSEESGTHYGTVRQIAPGERDELIVYIQNEGNFIIPSRAIRGISESKVILDPQQLDERARDAVSRARR